MPFPIAKVWREALQIKSFRIKIILTGILLLFCALSAPILFQFIQKREGITINDSLLASIQAFDLSLWIFILLYILIATSILSLCAHPNMFLLALQAYVILTLLRFATIFLVPLEPPKSMIELIDPFVQRLFYQQTITKDLFFSGHTSLLVLLAFVVPFHWLRAILITGSVAIAFALLIQHAHYTIDIVSAPLFSWLAFVLAKKFNAEQQAPLPTL